MVLTGGHLRRLNQPHQVFHDASSITGDGIHPKSDASAWPNAWLEVTSKAYPRLSTSGLPQPTDRTENALSLAIRRRRSNRATTHEPLDVRTLSDVLYVASGFADQTDVGTSVVRRHYPSAGARFPIESYVLALRCTGVACGVYHYDARAHCLNKLCEADGDRLSSAARAAFGHEWVAAARAILILTSVMSRTTVKYGARGYRFALLEAGHIMQNMCLVASSWDASLVPVGGFADQIVTRILDLHDTDELPLYAAVLP